VAIALERPPIAARAFLDALLPKKTPEQPERESADLRLDANGRRALLGDIGVHLSDIEFRPAGDGL
jgi:hypothetical protein